MSTAPTVPASPSRLLEHVAIGELSTALAVHTSYGPGSRVEGTFNINFGRRGAPFREWSSLEFPFTAEGQAKAFAKFHALVAAAAQVQSDDAPPACTYCDDTGTSGDGLRDCPRCSGRRAGAVVTPDPFYPTDETAADAALADLWSHRDARVAALATPAQLRTLAAEARVASHAAWRVLAGVSVCEQTRQSVERAALRLGFVVGGEACS